MNALEGECLCLCEISVNVNNFLIFIYVFCLGCPCSVVVASCLLVYPLFYIDAVAIFLFDHVNKYIIFVFVAFVYHFYVKR